MKKFTIIKKERVEIEWIGETIPDTETKVICVCDTRETAETALNEIFKSFPAEAKKKMVSKSYLRLWDGDITYSIEEVEETSDIPIYCIFDTTMKRLNTNK